MTYGERLVIVGIIDRYIGEMDMSLDDADREGWSDSDRAQNIRDHKRMLNYVRYDIDRACDARIDD